MRDRKAVIEENRKLSSAEAEVYDRNHFEIFHPWEQSRLQQEASKRAAHHRKVLDVGAGTGNVISKFPTTMDRIAFDLSPEMLLQATKSSPGIVPVVGDASSLPFRQQSFDLVITYSTLHHMPNALIAVEQAAELVAAGGTLVLDHEESFQEEGWRRWIYTKLRGSLAKLASAYYWKRPDSREWLPFRDTPWPLSDSLGQLDFQLTEGGQVIPEQIETLLRTSGFECRRGHYLLEPLPMTSLWQSVVNVVCRYLKIGHFFIEAKRPADD